MNILLDSNAFQSEELIKTLNKFPNANLFINSIIDLEKRFHYLLRGKISLWNTILKKLKIEILPISIRESRLAASFAQNFVDDPRGPSYFFRDCLIGASTITNELTLVTNNLKDFTYLPVSQIMTINEFIQSNKNN